MCCEYQKFNGLVVLILQLLLIIILNMIIVSEDNFQDYSKTLKNLDAPIADRTNALFCLRTLCTPECIKTLIDAFRSEPTSDLLRHEICYCLGQMNKDEELTELIFGFLWKLLEEGVHEDKHAKVVIHEAVEALANMGREESRKVL